MENPELKHYIDEQLAGGTPPDELKKLLVHHGWAPEIVDAHLSARVPMPPVPPAPALISGLEPMARPAAGDGDIYLVNRKKRIWGIVLVSLPILMIWAALIGYALSSFIASTLVGSSLGSAGASAGPAAVGAVGLGAQDMRTTVAKILGVAFGLFGLVGIIFLFILFPIGIYLIVKSGNELKPGVAYDERSGKGDTSVVPPEIKGWNWGAAFLSFYWGLYYRVWIMFLIFVPVIGGIWWIVLGIMGNQWAWQHNKWQSVEHFKRSQKKWVPWAITMLILGILATGLYFYFVMSVFFNVARTSGMSLMQNNLPATGLNMNVPSAGKAGKVVSIGADAKIFNILASDGKEYTVDMNGALFYSVGPTSETSVAVGDSVMVTGAESNGVIKAVGVADYGPSGTGLPGQ
jgi:MFS family permease